MTAVRTLSSFENFLQLMGVLVIFALVLVVTYLTTRWIASYQKGHSFNRNLQVLETLKIAPNKYIQIVQAGEEYLVIAVGKDEVRLLSKLTVEQLKAAPEETAPTSFSTESFKEVFDRIKQHIPKK